VRMEVRKNRIVACLKRRNLRACRIKKPGTDRVSEYREKIRRFLKRKKGGAG